MSPDVKESDEPKSRVHRFVESVAWIGRTYLVLSAVLSVAFTVVLTANWVSTVLLWSV